MGIGYVRPDQFLDHLTVIIIAAGYGPFCANTLAFCMVADHWLEKVQYIMFFQHAVLQGPMSINTLAFR